MKFRKNRHPHTLVINGAQYSATTGKALAQSASTPVSSPRPQTRHIDGLHHSSGSIAKEASTVHHAPANPPALKHVAVRSLDGPSKPAASHVTASQHRPVEAKQLHQRHVASSPTHPSAPHHSTAHAKAKVHISSPIPDSAAPKIAAESPAVTQGTSEAKARAERAQRIARSSHIRKFVSASPALTIAAAPPTTKKASHTPIPKMENMHHQPPLLSQYELAPHSDRNHHAEPSRSRKIIGHKARLASLSALGLSVLLIGGYVAYLNAPNLAVRIAASRSGVEAKLPGYSPDGYRYAGPINYRPGSVVVNFRSDSGQAFALAQEKSDWDSRSLLENVVAREDSDYQAYQEKGLTIYVYNGSDAAWVNDGIRYTIESSASLEPEQLLRLAASL